MQMKKDRRQKYLENIRLCLSDTINNIKNPDECKPYLAMKMDFTSSKHNDEKHLTHTKSDNKETMGGLNIEEIVNNFLFFFCRGIK